MQFEQFVDRWVRPSEALSYSRLLSLAENGQRVVGAIAVASLSELRGRPRWACVARTVTRLMRRCRIGEWALATRLVLSITQPGDPLYPWTVLAVGRSSDQRGIDRWLTAGETCLRHFDRLPPESAIPDATRRFRDEISNLCARLVQASSGIAIIPDGEATLVALGPGNKVPAAPLIAVTPDTLCVWDGITNRRSGRAMIRIPAVKDEAACAKREVEPDYDWSGSPVFRRLEVPSDQSPLASFVSEIPGDDNDAPSFWTVATDEDPLEHAEELGASWRTSTRPVVVFEVSAWEDPFETLALTLGLDARCGFEPIKEVFSDWNRAHEGRASTLPALIVAGTEVRPAQVDALATLLEGSARVAFVTATPAYDLHWPTRWRNRFPTRVSTREAAQDSVSGVPLAVRTLLNLGLPAIDAWQEAALHAFDLADRLDKGEAALAPLVQIALGRGELLDEPSTLAWLGDGHATVAANGTLRFVDRGWREFWFGLAGLPLPDGQTSAAWSAGHALSIRMRRDA